MEVILLERVAKLGQMGEVVRVKDGFARNFLLKRGKALRATADNRAKFDGMKAELEARNLKAKGEATKVAEKIDGRNVVVLRQASETGQLFGSVSVRDIITSFEHDGVTISRSQIMLDAPIKTIGKHTIAIAVHPEVEVGVTVTVARSADEAERINRGEDISTRQEDQDAAAEALAAAGEFFDPEAQHDDVAPQDERGFRPVTRPLVIMASTSPGLSAGLGASAGRLGDRTEAPDSVVSRSAARATLPEAARRPTGAAQRRAGGAGADGARALRGWKPPPRFRSEPPWTRLAEPPPAQALPAGAGSARCTGAALLPVSFGGSTLAASELASPEGLAAAGLPPSSLADPLAGFSALPARSLPAGPWPHRFWPRRSCQPEIWRHRTWRRRTWRLQICRPRAWPHPCRALRR